jgi:hypothetical protein
MEGTSPGSLDALARTEIRRSSRGRPLGQPRRIPVAEMPRDLVRGPSNPSVAYLASVGEVRVRLTAKAATRDEGRSMPPLVAEVGARLGTRSSTVDDEELEAAWGGVLRARPGDRSRAPSRSRAEGSEHG